MKVLPSLIIRAALCALALADVVAAQPKLNPVMVDLRFRQSAFFRSAVAEKERPGFKADEPVDAALLSRFRDWTKAQKITLSDADWQANLAAIKDQLTQELANVGQGLEAGTKVQMSRDPVIQKALDLMPQSEKLLQKQQLQLKVKDKPDAVAGLELQAPELLTA